MHRALFAALPLLLVACASGEREGGRPLVMDVAKTDDDASEPIVKDEPAAETPAPPEEEEETPAEPTATNTCQSARAIGSINGDSKATPLEATGAGGEWVSIVIKESESGPLAENLTARVTLTSPPSCEFDLFAFADFEKAEPSCTKEAGRSTRLGSAADTITLQWGEGWFVNFGDDSRTVHLEVRRTGSGTCAAGDKWKLKIEGDVDL